jgi:hypothetical protein
MFEQKRFAGRHLLTFESQKLNYFGKKSGAGILTLPCNSYLSHVRSCFKISSNFLKPRYCEKEKDKANKGILRSLSFDNNGLIKPSCGTVALYGPFGFF